MKTIKQGEILYIDKKYTDLSNGKERPCLVISNSTLSDMDEIIVLKITHTKRKDGFDFEIKNEMLNKPATVDGVVRLNDVQSLSYMVFESRRFSPSIKNAPLKKIIEKFNENFEMD